MKSKKSQLTMLVIIGIILTVIIVVGAEYFSGIGSSVFSTINNPDKRNLKLSFDTCLETTAREWLFVHGMRSGNYQGTNTSYGLNVSVLDMPDIEQIELDLNQFLLETRHICICNNTMGYNISLLNNPQLDVTISSTKVIIGYSDVFTAEREDTSFTPSGSIDFDYPVYQVFRHSTDLLSARRNSRYIRDDELILMYGDIIEGSRIQPDIETWLITRNIPNSQPYYLTFLVRITRG